jgi:GT2 family glycosyltransferase
MKLHGILVTFRHRAKLIRMLRGLNEQERKLDTLSVIDTTPSEERESVVQRFARGETQLDYVAVENIGPDGGIAFGMQRILNFASDADWILSLDHDDPPFASTLLADLSAFAQHMIEEDPRVGGIGLMGVLFDWKRCVVVEIPKDALDAGAVPVDALWGQAFPLYRVSAVREVGPFCQELFFGWGELEYGLRLRRAGLAMYVPGPLGQEALSYLTPARPWPPWRKYYAVRNYIYILRRVGRNGRAVRVTISAVGRPALRFMRAPTAAIQELGIGVRAGWDAWGGRMGRRIDPPYGQGTE